MRAVSAAVLLALGLAGTAGAQDLTDVPPAEQYGLRLQYSEFRPSITGETRKSSATQTGTDLDLVDDLGIQDDRTFEAKATIQFKRGRKIRLSYTPLDWKGDTTATETYFYGTSRFSRGSRIVTSMKGSYVSADFEWDFVKGPKGYLGAVVGAKAFDIDAVILSVNQQLRETDTLRVPIPVIGLAGRGYTGRLSLGGEIVGLSAGERGYIVDGEGSVRLHVSDRLAAQVGYRVLNLDGKDKGDRVKLRLGGITFGVELSL